MTKVRESQVSGKRLQAHYLSDDAQNGFINACGEMIQDHITNQVLYSKYYSLIVDATPDASHKEQTTVILRYVKQAEDDQFQIYERFVTFLDFSKKKGAEIAANLLAFLRDRGISISLCRGQGYDNGSNMSGKYKGAQQVIMKENSLAIYSPCACHSLNLCGVHAAECCPDAIMFFGSVQKLYNFFSSSPPRREILKKHIGGSLHSSSQIRWSARINAVQPVCQKLPSVLKAIDEIEDTLDISSEARADIANLIKYFKSFKAIILATTWFKILKSIDMRTKVLQLRNTTIDAEVRNLDSLSDEMRLYRDSWASIFEEASLVADELHVPKHLKENRRQSNASLSPSEVQEKAIADFKINVYITVIDRVIAEISRRFKSTADICKRFSFFGCMLR